VAPAQPSRKQARRDALFVLYQHEVTSSSFDVLFTRMRASEGRASSEFSKQLVEGVAERRAEIDDCIGAHSRTWSLARMAPLERNILRLATFELLDEATPAAVVIDEAVRLAKRYASDEAGSLVNGVLGGILKDRQVSSGEE
jgi:N utilization substance protein B